MAVYYKAEIRRCKLLLFFFFFFFLLLFSTYACNSYYDNVTPRQHRRIIINLASAAPATKPECHRGYSAPGEFTDFCF